MQPTEDSPPRNYKGIKIFQGIVGKLLYIVRAVNNNLRVALSAIGAQQAAAAEATKYAIKQLLDYPASTCDAKIISLFLKSMPSSM